MAPTCTLATHPSPCALLPDPLPRRFPSRNKPSHHLFFAAHFPLQVGEEHVQRDGVPAGLVGQCDARVRRRMEGYTVLGTYSGFQMTQHT